MYKRQCHCIWICFQHFFHFAGINGSAPFKFNGNRLCAATTDDFEHPPTKNTIAGNHNFITRL